MTKANDSGNRQVPSGHGIALDGAGRIAPLSEGYWRKGGQNATPAASAPRPPAPPPFRPSPAPASQASLPTPTSANRR